MTKVRCINIKGSFEKGIPVPEVGSEYTIIHVIPYHINRKPMDFYVLKELGLDNMYAQIMFAPLDGPDEVAMAEARTTEHMARVWKGVEKSINNPEPNRYEKR